MTDLWSPSGMVVFSEATSLEGRPKIRATGSLIKHSAPGCGHQNALMTHETVDPCLTVTVELNVPGIEIRLIDFYTPEILYVLKKVNWLDSARVWFLENGPDFLVVRISYPGLIQYQEHVVNFIDNPSVLLNFEPPLEISA